MRINLVSVLVDDQDKALRFYTEILGFRKKRDIPLGEHRWITVTAAEDPNVGASGGTTSVNAALSP